MIGEARREFHRQSIAQATKDQRDKKGWSQEDLAERLGVDRRQVVRLEAGKMPATLELIEELARTLGVSGWVFLYSTIDPHPHRGDVDINKIAEETNRGLAREIRERFRLALDRPDLEELVMLAMGLAEPQLVHVTEVARAFRLANPYVSVTSGVDPLHTARLITGVPFSRSRHAKRGGHAKTPKR